MSDESPNLTEIADGVFRVASQLGERRIAQWLAIGESGILLVDTGTYGDVGRHIVPALRSLGRRPGEITDVAITHADVDHYGGNAEIRDLAPGARIRSSALDRAQIESWATIRRVRYGWYEKHGLAYPPEVMAWLKEAGGPDTSIDGTLAEGATIDLGGVVLRTLELPGHSAGHLGFLVDGSRCAIIADAALERGLYDVSDKLISPPPYVTSSGYREALAKLVDLDLERLETAHYREIVDDDVTEFLARSRGFVDELEGIVLDQLASGRKTVLEITTVADRQLGPFSAMGLELARSVGAHLEELTADGRVRSTDAEGLPSWELA